MTAAYSLDLRERIIQTKLTGQYTNKEIAEIFMIGITSVKEYFRKYRDNESLVPNKPGGRHPIIEDAEKILIRKYISDNPDATLAEYCKQLEIDTGKSVTVQCMHYVIKGLKISYKKKPVCPGTRS